MDKAAAPSCLNPRQRDFASCGVAGSARGWRELMIHSASGSAWLLSRRPRSPVSRLLSCDLAGELDPSIRVQPVPRAPCLRAISSEVEHYLDTVGVTGSIPVSPTFVHSHPRSDAPSRLCRRTWCLPLNGAHQVRWPPPPIRAPSRIPRPGSGLKSWSLGPWGAPALRPPPGRQPRANIRGYAAAADRPAESARASRCREPIRRPASPLSPSVRRTRP